MVNAQAWQQFWVADHAQSQARFVTENNRLAPEWEQILAQITPPAADVTIADLACGGGALIAPVGDWALAHRLDFRQFCIDFAPAAVADLGAEDERLCPLVADVSSLPLADQTTSLVVSQYGIEYAGLPAFSEAARIVAPGGALAVIAHHGDGAIFSECGASATAVERVLTLAVLDLAAESVDAAAKVAAGQQPAAILAPLQQRIQRAGSELKALLNTNGADVAGGLIAQLFQDLSALFANPRGYQAPEVAAWARGMTAELESYHQRMAAMTASALSQDAAHEAAAALASEGLVLRGEGPREVKDGDTLVGWRFIADRPAA